MFRIVAKNITKSYEVQGQDDLVVLENISLTIEQEESISIVGASGTGKSTLLHIIGTIDKPNSGELLLYDNNEQIDLLSIPDKKLNKIRNQQIGFVFQFHHLLPEFSAYENIILPAIIGSEKKEQYHKKADNLLKFIGLENRKDHKPNKLSGGEQQRIAIARAIINNPKLVIADEPTGNLDQNNSDMVMELFTNITNEFGTAVVMATHNLEVASFANKKYKLTKEKLLNLE